MQYFADIAKAIAAHLDSLRLTGALAARPGRVLDADGYPTNVRAVVLLAEPQVKLTDVPDNVAGFPVDVRPATPAQQLKFTQPEAFRAQSLASRGETVLSDFPGEIALEPSVAVALATPAAPSNPYAPPSGATYPTFSLPNVTVVCSVSPDNGWSVLESFLGDTKAALTTAMYDFTSAHIEQAVAADLAGKTFELVLDNPPKNPTADQTDESTVQLLQTALKSGFAQQWALTPRDPTGATKIFETSYHIKVAVRDAAGAGAAVWLSSGNWNNSNQPVFDYQNPDQALAKKSDRDWHVVIYDAQLAMWFETFIDHDFQVAKAANAAASGAAALPQALPEEAVEAPAFATFVPSVTIAGAMTIQPLLTPDSGVYVDAIGSLIDKAMRTVDMQFQYVDSFAQPGDEKFAGLIEALARAQARGVALRFIFSEFQQEAILELMAEAKLAVDRDHVRIQNNVHNKGMLVDGTWTVVSSQNWSGAGVLHNRDAGVIIDNAQVNAYFQARFDHDWQNLATAKPKPPAKKPTTSAGNDLRA